MSEKFTSPLYVRCPPSMTDLIEKVAESQFTTVSDYVRAAVVDRLTNDIEGDGATYSGSEGHS